VRPPFLDPGEQFPGFVLAIADALRKIVRGILEHDLAP
jgi:hypothetical protein